MADLGNLFFSLGLDTKNIDAAWDKALAKYGKEAKIMLKFDTKEFTQQAEAQKLLQKQSMNDATLRTKAARDAISLREKEALMAEKIHTQEARTQAVRERSANAIKNTNTALTTQNRLMQNLHTMAASYISIFAAGRLIRELVTVSGEFEMQRASLQAILKDLEGANKIFDQIKKLSVQSPFQFKDLISYTKQLSAFSIPMGELYDTTKMLSDVSAGLGVGMDRLVLAYGQIRAASVLRGQEIRQLTEAGIPVIEELRKKFEELGETGITAADVFDKVSARLVPFEMIKEMFEDMTSEGGKFYKMQEIQAETLKGKVSNLKDAYQIMFAEIGEKGDGVLKGAVDSTRWLIENYEVIGKTIMELVTVYGVYKASLIAITIYQRLYAAAVLYSAASSTSLNVAQLALSATTNALTAAQTRLNAAIMKNPYVLAAAAVAALGYGLYKMITYQNEAQKAQERLNDSFDESQKLLGKEIAQLDMLYGTLKAAKEGTIQYTKAKEAIEKQYAPYLKQLAEENGGVLNLVDAYELLRKKLIEVQQEKGYQKAIETALDAYSEGISKQAEKIGRQINKSTLSGLEKETLKASLMDVLWGKMEYKDIESGTKKLFESFTETVGSEKEGTKYVRNTLQPILDKASEINGAFKEVQKSAQTMFKSDGGLIGPVIDMSKVMLSSKAWVQSIEAFIKQQGIEGLGLSKRQEESPEDYIGRLRDEFDTITSQLSLRSKLTGEDITQLTNKLKNLKSIFGIIGVSPTEQKGGNTNDYQKKQIELLNNRVELINQIKKAYENLSNIVGKGNENAAQSLISTLFADTGVSTTPADFQSSFKKQIEDIIVKMQGLGNEGKDAAEKIRDEMDKAFRDQVIKDFEQSVKEANKVIEYTNELLKNQNAKQGDLNMLLAERDNLLSQIQDTDPLADERRNAIVADYAEKINKLGQEMLKIYNLDKLMEGDGASYIRDEIKKVLPLFKSLSDATPKDLKKIQKVLSELEIPQEVLDKLKQFGIDIEALKAALIELGKLSKEQLDEKKYKDTLSRVNEIAGAIGEIGNEIKGFGGAWEEVGGAISGVASQAGNLVTALSKGSDMSDKISAGIAALTDMVMMVIRQVAANKKAQEEWNLAIIDGQHQMSLLNIESKKYQEANLFGVENPYARAIAGATQYAQAMSELNKNFEGANVQIGTKKVVSGANVAKGAGAGAAIGAVVGTAIPVIGNLIGAAIGAVIGGIVGLLSTKTVPIWESLASKYGQIFNETFDLNPKIIADYKKLNAEGKALVDNWEEIKKKAQEAQAEMRENFRDLAGDMGTNLSDALVDAFSNGNIYNAVDKFQDYTEKMIESIVSQLIFARYFQKYFDELEDRFNKSMEMGGDQDIIDDIEWFAEQYKGSLDDYNAAMTAYREAMREKGFNLFTPEQSVSNSVGAGIQGVTEQTANLLGSYLNAVRADVAANRADFKGIVPVIGNINDLMGNSLAELQMINSNTRNTAINTREVADILKAATMRGGATQLNTRVVV